MSKSLSPSPIEQVSCPCGTPLSAEIAFRTPTRTYRRCPPCGLVFFSPRPSGSRTTEFYRDSYEGTYRRFERGSIRAPMFRSALRHLSKYRRPLGACWILGVPAGIFGSRVIWAASFEVIARPSTGQSEAASKQEGSR